MKIEVLQHISRVGFPDDTWQARRRSSLGSQLFQFPTCTFIFGSEHGNDANCLQVLNVRLLAKHTLESHEDDKHSTRSFIVNLKNIYLKCLQNACVRFLAISF